MDHLSDSVDVTFRRFLPQSSLLLNCQASRKPWRASQMTALFIFLLSFPSFLGAAVSVTYTLWRWVRQTKSRPINWCNARKLFPQQIPQPQTLLRRAFKSHIPRRTHRRTVNTDFRGFRHISHMGRLLIVLFHRKPKKGKKRTKWCRLSLRTNKE